MLAGSGSFSTIMARIRPGTSVNTKQVNAKLQRLELQLVQLSEILFRESLK